MLREGKPGSASPCTRPCAQGSGQRTHPGHPRRVGGAGGEAEAGHLPCQQRDFALCGCPAGRVLEGAVPRSRGGGVNRTPEGASGAAGHRPGSR